MSSKLTRIKLTLVATFLFAINVRAQTVASLPSTDGINLHGEFYEAAQPKAILLVVHGLQSHVGWYRNGQANAEMGISSFAFDRRGSGRSSGTRGDSVDVDDFMEDFGVALKFVNENNPEKVPVHIMANSLGAVISLQYIAKFSPEIASLILTTPGTHSTAAGDYTWLEKLQILTAPALKYFESPLENTDFVGPGPFLDWINADELGNRFFTAEFLRAVNAMKSDITEAAQKPEIPLFALLANQDDIIDNAAFEKKIFTPYRGPKELRHYDSKHYLFFGQDSAQVVSDIQGWILAPSAF